MLGFLSSPAPFCGSSIPHSFRPASSSEPCTSLRLPPRASGRGVARLDRASRGDPKRGIRPARIAEVLRLELSAIIDDAIGRVRNFGDGTPVMMSVERVEVSADLRNARVQVKVEGNAEQRRMGLKWLKKNRGILKYEVTQRGMRGMKRVPELIFVQDAEDSVHRTVEIIEKLEEERRRREGEKSQVMSVGEDVVEGLDLELDSLTENVIIDEDDEDEEEDYIVHVGSSDDEDEEEEHGNLENSADNVGLSRES